MAQREGWSLFTQLYRYYEGARRVWKWEVGWYSNLDRETVVASGVEAKYLDAKAAMEKSKSHAAASDSFELSTRRREKMRV